MDIALEITLMDGEYCVDSRLLAKHLGYEHKPLMRNIRRHQTRLEQKSSLRQIDAVKQRASRGATREVYYMLNERQCLILTGSLKKGTEAEEWHDTLVDAFLQVRDRVRKLEAQQSISPIHTLTEQFRPRALENLRRVPEGYFSVMGELFKHLYNAEALLNRSLDEHAMIEISVGQRWSRYARETLSIPDNERCKYAHICQGGRIEQVWAYPIQYVTTFDKWLWTVYFPVQFAEYEQFRQHYLALPAPHKHRDQREHLPALHQPQLLS